MRYETNMTVKGQITVPKDIRDALGLKPGQRVGIEMDSHGNATILKIDDAAEREQWLDRVKETQRTFGGRDRFMGMDGVEYQRWLRDGGPEV